MEERILKQMSFNSYILQQAVVIVRIEPYHTLIIRSITGLPTATETIQRPHDFSVLL